NGFGVQERRRRDAKQHAHSRYVDLPDHPRTAVIPPVTYDVSVESSYLSAKGNCSEAAHYCIGTGRDNSVSAMRTRPVSSDSAVRGAPRLMRSASGGGVRPFQNRSAGATDTPRSRNAVTAAALVHPCGSGSHATVDPAWVRISRCPR